MFPAARRFKPASQALPGPSITANGRRDEESRFVTGPSEPDRFLRRRNRSKTAPKRCLPGFAKYSTGRKTLKKPKSGWMRWIAIRRRLHDGRLTRLPAYHSRRPLRAMHRVTSRVARKPFGN